LYKDRCLKKIIKELSQKNPGLFDKMYDLGGWTQLMGNRSS
jgi:hypothetical protein